MSLRDEIMALPVAERLPYALDLLDEITGNKLECHIWLKDNYGLSKSEASLFLMLNNNAPKVMSKERIYRAVWGESDVEIKIIDVMVCKIRKKGLKIKTHWGIGYSVEERIEVGMSKDSGEIKRGVRWTAENDNDLINMVDSGSSLRAMAYELERTERGVNERILWLKKEGRL